jgi:Stage II sporulation protein E (SpoIIE)/GAF domain
VIGTGVRVSDDQGFTAGVSADRATVDRTGRLLPPRLMLPDATADPSRLARQVLQAVVPGFADAAAVFVHEELLSVSAGAEGGVEQGELVLRRLAAGFTADGRRLAVETSFPLGEVVVFASDSHPARCVRNGAPAMFTQPSGATLQRIAPGAATILAGYSSFLAAPMVTRGTPAGVLVLARGQSAPAFSAADARAAADLAGRAGVALAGSLALMRHRSVAEALRPPRLTANEGSLGGLEIAGRCLPAAGCDTGGDWYDVIPLPGQRIGLIVGDVMGHGPQAATVMTRLSAAAYALADLDLPPPEVLRQLNRTALALPQETLVTCAYAVIDPATQSCVIATAGHLPPVLAMPDGTTRVPGIPGGQSLGIAPATYGESRVKLRPGTILCLYTDGLVETRTRPFDQGILALQSALARQHPDLDATCEQVLSTLGDLREDDITLVLGRVPAAGLRQPSPLRSGQHDSDGVREAVGRVVWLEVGERPRAAMVQPNTRQAHVARAGDIHLGGVTDHPGAVQRLTRPVRREAEDRRVRLAQADSLGNDPPG